MPFLIGLFWVVLILSAILAKITGTDLWSGFTTLLGIVSLMIWAAIIYGIYRFIMYIREPVARWYYFNFHPHPAEPAIRAALSDSTVLNGKQLSTILGEPPADNAILRAVRAEQAQSLIAEMEAMTKRRIWELEAHAKEQYEQAAAQQLQAALAQSAIALEQAKAMLHARQGVGR